MDSISNSGDAKQEKNTKLKLSFVDSLFMMYNLIKKIAKARSECKAYDNIRLYSHNFGDFVFFKSMNFRSSYLENIAEEKNKELNTKARKQAVEYYLEVLHLQYNTLLFNCEKSFNEIIIFRLLDEFIVPLFEGKTFDQYLII